MSYILQRRKSLPNGMVTETLNTQGEWCIATSTPMRFSNTRKASDMALALNHYGKAVIIGEKGGRYKVRRSNPAHPMRRKNVSI